MIKNIICLSVLLLPGCADTLNYGHSDFGCNGIPGGKACVSTEDAYNDSNGDLSASAWKHSDKEKDKHTSDGVKKHAKHVVKQKIILPDNHDPMPIRTPAKVMRIWVAPWEDSNGDLHMASLVYTEIQKRRWIVGEKVGDGGTGGNVFPLFVRQAGSVEPNKVKGEKRR